MENKIDDENKLNEYKQRHREWRDISVTQLSNTNNILLTLASGLLVFSFDKNKVLPIHLCSSNKIDWPVFTYAASVILMFFSIAYGIAVLVSRIYDFRISRNLALTRQRFYKNDIQKTIRNKNSGTLPDNDLGKFYAFDRMRELKQIAFKEPLLISTKEIDELSKIDLKRKFQNLRRISKILGSASWIWTKYQIWCFALSGLIYVIYQLFLTTPN